MGTGPFVSIPASPFLCLWWEAAPEKVLGRKEGVGSMPWKTPFLPSVGFAERALCSLRALVSGFSASSSWVGLELPLSSISQDPGRGAGGSGWVGDREASSAGERKEMIGSVGQAQGFCCAHLRVVPLGQPNRVTKKERTKPENPINLCNCSFTQ